jgi:drug/metabolite transporter (DMT)-like permease
MQNWIVLSTLAGLASNGFHITNRTVLKDKGDSTAYAWWFEVARTLFFLFIVLRQPLPSFNLNSLLVLGLAGVSELFSVYVFMRMHALTELSISSVISRLRVVWSPIIAWLFISERLSLTEYLGIFAIFAGIAIVSSPAEIKKDKGIKMAFLFSISSALLSVVLKGASAIASSEIIIISQGILPIIALPLLMRNSVSRIIKSAVSNSFAIVLASVFNISSSYLIVEALRVADASKVVGVYQAMTILSVFYGIIILKERAKIAAKMIGTVIVLVGIIATVV